MKHLKDNHLILRSASLVDKESIFKELREIHPNDGFLVHMWTPGEVHYSTYPKVNEEEVDDEPSNYYFIVYEWKSSSMDQPKKENCVSTKHPVLWLKDRIDYSTERHIITFWQEIDKEHFDLLDDWVD